MQVLHVTRNKTAIVYKTIIAIINTVDSSVIVMC